MNDAAAIADLMRDLLHASEHGSALDWPPTSPPDLQAAYATALAVRAARIDAGAIPVGYKVGFTNRNLWPVYGVYAPIWGTVWRSTLTRIEPGAANEALLSLARLHEPRIEPEVVFGLRAAPPPNCSLLELAAAIDWVAHGFEIVQSHFRNWKFSAAQAVADGGLHGHLLVGHSIDVGVGWPAAQLADALSAIDLKLYCDGVLKDQGAGTNVLDGPLQALLHFVESLRATPGAPELMAGDVVTTGTLTDAHPVRVGETWHTGIVMPGHDPAGQLKPLTVRFG